MPEIFEFGYSIENADNGRNIMELKQYEEPATAKYQPQPAPQQRLNEIRLAFWPELDGSDYDLVELQRWRLVLGP